MSELFEGRKSDSPYIDRVWRGCFEQDYMPICPADARRLRRPITHDALTPPLFWANTNDAHLSKPG